MRYWCDYALVGTTVHERVLVTADDGRISDVEVDVDQRSDVVPSSECEHRRGLTVPGFANSHSHAFHRALRGRTHAGNGSFWTWREQMYLAADRLDPASYFRLARATFAEMALAGISSVGEFHYLHHQANGKPYDDVNAMGLAVIAAAHEAGVRITLLDTLYLHGGLNETGYTDLNRQQARFSDGSAERWVDRVGELDDGPSTRIGAAVHSVRAVDPTSMKTVATWAHETAKPVHAHVSEQPAENIQCLAAHRRTPTALLNGSGLLAPGFTAVHATHLNHDDIALLGSSNSYVCFCPTTERDLADGVGPSLQLAGAGANITFGSDSHAVIDMFEEARSLEFNIRLVTHERGHHTAKDLATMATVNGHRSLGWNDAGEFRIGARADLVTIRLDSVRTAGSGNGSALDTAVFAATAADVTDVVIDGRTVVRDGRHVNIDVGAELTSSIAALMDR